MRAPATWRNINDNLKINRKTLNIDWKFKNGLSSYNCSTTTVKEKKDNNKNEKFFQQKNFIRGSKRDSNKKQSSLRPALMGSAPKIKLTVVVAVYSRTTAGIMTQSSERN